MTDPLPEDQRLKAISPKAYEHPADRAATAALQSIPMLDVVVRKLIEFGYERALRQIFLAGSLKLGSEQLPTVWASHRAACARLDLPDVPDLYLTQFPITNAAGSGAARPIVMFNSRPAELLDEDELHILVRADFQGRLLIVRDARPGRPTELWPTERLVATPSESRERHHQVVMGALRLGVRPR